MDNILKWQIEDTKIIKVCNANLLEDAVKTLKAKVLCRHSSYADKKNTFTTEWQSLWLWATAKHKTLC